MKYSCPKCREESHLDFGWTSPSVTCLSCGYSGVQLEFKKKKSKKDLKNLERYFEEESIPARDRDWAIRERKAVRGIDYV